MIQQPEGVIYKKRIKYLLLILISLLTIGTLVYNTLEGWDYIDSLYFSTATITTVGYGDFSPKTSLGKLFTIVYLLFGVGTGLYTLSVIASHYINLRESYWTERMNNIQIKKPNFIEKLKSFFNKNT